AEAHGHHKIVQLIELIKNPVLTAESLSIALDISISAVDLLLQGATPEQIQAALDIRETNSSVLRKALRKIPSALQKLLDFFDPESQLELKIPLLRLAVDQKKSVGVKTLVDELDPYQVL